MGKGSFFGEPISRLLTGSGSPTACAHCNDAAAGKAGYLGGGCTSCTCEKQSCLEDDLLDLLESGFAREGITDECLRPNPTEHWSRCQVMKVRKGHYVMRWDKKQRFMLSAQLNEDGSFDISQYESLEDSEGGRPCALLVPSGPKSFKLFSTSCEMCDGPLSKFHCKAAISNEEGDAASPSKDACPPGGRQMLATIQHACLFEQHTGTEMRSISCSIPTVSKDGKRACWCPRQPRTDGTVSHLSTNLPEWSEELGCLVQQFNKDRVKKASSKNFIVTADGTATAARGGPRKILQFGKCAKSLYILDFKQPLAAVQAFAICVSHWNWKG